MTKRTTIPKNIGEEVTKRVETVCEERNYLSLGNLERSALYDEMVNMKTIGGVLKEYMPKEKVRTQIKDVYVNKYAKKKRKSINNTADAFAIEYLGTDNYRKAGTKDTPIYIYRDRILITAYGTTDRWETALKHALDSKYKLLSKNNSEPEQYSIVLRLTIRKGKLTNSDLETIINTLKMINVEVDFNEL